MVILARYIFRKQDSLWFPHEDVGKGTQSSWREEVTWFSLSLPQPRFPRALQAESVARHLKGQTVVKSCAAAEGMTQIPELPGGHPVWVQFHWCCGCAVQGVCNHLWTSILQRPPRRQSGWIRPEHKNTSLIPPLQTSWFKSTKIFACTPSSTLNPGLRIPLFKDLENTPEGPGVSAGSLALGRSWQGMYYKKQNKANKTETAPWLPTLWRLEGRVSGRGRSLQSDMSCTKAHGQGSFSSLCIGFPDTSCVQEKGQPGENFPTWPRVDDRDETTYLSLG